MRVQELSRQQVSPLALVTGGASASSGPLAGLALLQVRPLERRQLLCSTVKPSSAQKQAETEQLHILPWYVPSIDGLAAPEYAPGSWRVDGLAPSDDDPCRGAFAAGVVGGHTAAGSKQRQRRPVGPDWGCGGGKPRRQRRRQPAQLRPNAAAGADAGSAGETRGLAEIMTTANSNVDARAVPIPGSLRACPTDAYQGPPQGNSVMDVLMVLRSLTEGGRRALSQPAGHRCIIRRGPSAASPAVSGGIAGDGVKTVGRSWRSAALPVEGTAQSAERRWHMCAAAPSQLCYQ